MVKTSSKSQSRALIKSGRHGVDSGLLAGCGHAAPLDPVIIAPTTHTSAAKVPKNWPKGAQPLNPKHHLIAGQGNDEEVQHKFPRVDEELDVGADASAGHPVAIGDGYLEPEAEQRLVVETTGRLSGDEGMGGAGVDKGHYNKKYLWYRLETYILYRLQQPIQFV
jgi:hypothetical protein